MTDITTGPFGATGVLPKREAGSLLVPSGVLPKREAGSLLVPSFARGTKKPVYRPRDIAEPEPPPWVAGEALTDPAELVDTVNDGFLKLEPISDCGRCGLSVKTQVCTVVLTPVVVSGDVQTTASVSRKQEVICPKCWTHMNNSLDQLKARVTSQEDSVWDIM